MSKILLPRFRKLFDFAIDEIFASGGDGCGIIGFRYTSLDQAVEQFEFYLIENPSVKSILKEKRIKEGRVTFDDNSNESISFYSSENMPPYRGQEIYLQVY